MGLNTPADTTIVFLAGGKGTRLQAVNPDRPKPMVEVAGKPFLQWVVQEYVNAGYWDFIVSTGYKGDVIQGYGWAETFPQARFRFKHEAEPLGTGGATRMIFDEFSLKSAWVVNGDTLVPEALSTPEVDTEAHFTLLEPGQVYDADPNVWVRGSRVLAEGTGDLLEKQYFDAGVIFVTREGIGRSSNQRGSLFELLKPSMLARQVSYSVLHGTCYDIGTPDRLKRFEEYIRDLRG